MENTVETNTTPIIENQGAPIQADDDGQLDDVLVMTENGELVPAVAETVEPEQEQRAPQPATGDDGQTTKPFYRSQREVDAAIGARLAAERKKHEPDLDLSRKVRTLFSGMTDEEIAQRLVGVAANQYAEEKNIPVEVASAITDLRMNFPQGAPTTVEPETPTEPAQEPNQRIKGLADEAAAIEQKYGFDMAQILAADRGAQKRVFQDGESLYSVLIDHMKSQQQPTHTITPTRSPNGAGSVMGSGMTDEYYERVKAAVKSGKTVRLE